MRYNITQIVSQLAQFKVIPVIALDNAENILPLADTLTENGLPVVEITFRSSVASDAISRLRQYNPDILIIAGTVLTAEQVVEAKNSGADIVVTPGFNPKIVQLCQDLNIPIIPGVNNPMSIEATLDAGINTVKFFPAEASGGVNMLKSLLGPYPDLEIMPTGGINLANIQTYLAIKNVVACGGSWFVDKSLIHSQNWQEIGRLTRQAVELIRK